MTGRKILIALTALFLNLVCFAAMLYVSAYLVDKDEIVNAATVGGSRIEIIEDFTGPDQIEPGMSVPKEVRIRNMGPNPCLVRVFIAFSDGLMRENANIAYNEADWEKRGDGYWYYRESLAPGRKTPALFQSVDISADADADKLKGFEVIVSAECVDSETGVFK